MSRELHSLTIPDETTELGSWLDKYLMSDVLSDLVGELACLSDDERTPATEADVKSVLANDLEALLANGCAALDRQKIKKLLRRPQLLLTLQEMILLQEQSNSHWKKLLDESESLSQIAESTKKVVDRQLSSSSEELPNDQDLVTRKAFWKPLFVACSIAASILLIVALRDTQEEPKKPEGTITQPSILRGENDGKQIGKESKNDDWLWSRDSIIEQVPKKNVWPTLTNALSEWFSLDPSRFKTKSDLQDRLSEAWIGCENILNMESDQFPVGSDQEIKKVVENLQQGLTDVIAKANDATDETIDPLKKEADRLIQKTIDSFEELSDLQKQ